MTIQKNEINCSRQELLNFFVVLDLYYYYSSIYTPMSLYIIHSFYSFPFPGVAQFHGAITNVVILDGVALTDR